MSPKKTYTAVYKRDPRSDAWNVQIQGLQGCSAHGRSIQQGRRRIRKALGLQLRREPAGLVIQDQLPAGMTKISDNVVQAREEAERARLKSQRETRVAVRKLTDLGLSRRDAAEILGLSYQRIQQLLEG